MRKILATFVTTLALAGSGAWTTASAGDVWRQCDAKHCTLEFEGAIGPGDAVRLTRAVHSAPEVVQIIEFNSPGGDAFEALAMADLLNEDFIVAATAWCGPDGCIGIPGGGFRGASSCASACALVFLAANNRFGTEVYLHRPTFPSATFAELSGSQAHHAYDAAVDRLLAALRDRRVPDAELQLMMNMASDGLLKLESGYPTNSPWLAEWLIAKCGPHAPGGTTNSASVVNEIVAHVNCETDAIEREQRRAQRKAG
jgi:hypothetical protein